LLPIDFTFPSERGYLLATKNIAQMCVLNIITHGFDEIETISLISTLRQAGLCTKIVAATSGLVSGAYGICLMPDLTFSDLDCVTKTATFGAVILPENRQCLAKLESDPRLHNLLRQVLAAGGRVVAGTEGKQFLRKISIGVPGIGSSSGDEPLLLLREQGQSIEAFARSLLYSMGQPVRA